jgi:hypothetical protein
MAQVGVFPVVTQAPASVVTPYNTMNAFIVAEADWGPVGVPTPVSSLANVANIFGTPSGSGNPYSSRTTTCANLFDACDTLFHEDGYTTPAVYVSRVVGPTPVNATLVLNNTVPSASLTLTAVYPGVGGNGIYVVVVNTGGTSYVITLQDSAGNVLATSPSLTTAAAGVTWAATTGYVTAVAGTGIPVSLSATALATGTDNRGSATITNWTTALTAFAGSLGPGQVFAPGITNTTLSGIWSALGTHAFNNNRVAVCDMDDDVSAATLVSDIASFGTTSVGSYCAFWGGNRTIPGTTPGTTRSVSPSSVIAALCARVDSGGNPNLAAAGVNYPLDYATSAASLVSGTTDTYSLADLETLNGAGINTFQTIFGQPLNYGFVSSVPSTTDTTFWQWNHARLRMAIVAEAQIIGQPYVFAQIDGTGSTATQFGNALQGMLASYYAAGALFGATAAAAYVVNVGPTVNTPTTMAAGQLNAQIGIRMSPYAQMVTIVINVSPITTAVVA